MPQYIQARHCSLDQVVPRHFLELTILWRARQDAFVAALTTAMANHPDAWAPYSVFDGDDIALWLNFSDAGDQVAALGVGLSAFKTAITASGGTIEVNPS